MPVLGGDDAFDDQMLQALRNNATLNPNAVTLVDLTDDPGMPPTFGHRDEEMVYPGSMVKIAAMYAAFELRSRVQQQADATAHAVSPGSL